jgi:hypothetical protein
MEDATTSTPSTPAPRRATVLITRALWLSAGVLLGLVLFRSDPLSFGEPIFKNRGDKSHAGMIGQAGPFTLMTSTASNEELFIVVDGRDEQMMVYKVENGNAANLLQKASLPRLFLEAKSRSGFGGK